MHHIAVRKQLLADLKAFKKNPRPEGPDVRPMTRQEVEHYSATVADTYSRLERLDNSEQDRSPQVGVVRTRSVSTNSGITDGANIRTREALNANFGGRSKALEVTEDFEKVDLKNPGQPLLTTTDILFAEQNILFTTGIVLSQENNTSSGVSFFIDRRDPSASLIQEHRPKTARGFRPPA